MPVMRLGDYFGKREKRQGPKGDGSSGDPCGLLEKYFHSLGAWYMEEGKLDEAEEALRRALHESETPWARGDLGRVLSMKGLPGEALRELDRACELAPGVPDYLHERGKLRRKVGDPTGAASDLEMAFSLDPNYRRIDEISAAIQAIREVLTEPETQILLREARPRDGTLRVLIDELNAVIESREALFSGSSCPVLSCPAYCCHFTGPMVRHGVTIGPWKLKAIKEHLQDCGLSPDDFLKYLSFHGEIHVEELIPPPYRIREGEEVRIYCPKRQEHPINPALLAGLPKAQDYHTLMWIDKHARPCTFLHEKRCTIHDAGDDQGLPSCKQFLCLTGTVFLILGHIGLKGDDLPPDLPMETLNQYAVESLLLLASAYANPALAELRQKRGRALIEALRADKARDHAALAARCEEARDLMRRYENALRESENEARNRITAVRNDAGLPRYREKLPLRPPESG